MYKDKPVSSTYNAHRLSSRTVVVGAVFLLLTITTLTWMRSYSDKDVYYPPSVDFSKPILPFHVTDPLVFWVSDFHISPSGDVKKVFSELSRKQWPGHPLPPLEVTSLLTPSIVITSLTLPTLLLPIIY